METEDRSKKVGIVVTPYITNSKGELLLTRSPKWPEVWIVPGGHVERGETLEQTAIREAKEEVGLDITIAGSLGYLECIDLPEFYVPAHWIAFSFIADCGENTISTIDHKEITEARWFGLEKIEKLKIPEGMKVFIDRYKKYLAGEFRDSCDRNL